MKQRFFLLVLALLGLGLLVPHVRAADGVRVEVRVYLDVNGDRVMSAGEGVSGLPVTLRLGERAPQTRLTEDGLAVFPLGAWTAQDGEAQVDIPYLAASERVKIAKEGATVIEFRLPAPEIPVYLP